MYFVFYDEVEVPWPAAFLLFLLILRSPRARNRQARCSHADVRRGEPQSAAEVLLILSARRREWMLRGC